MSSTKIQWHPGFAAAMNLELKEYRKDLMRSKSPISYPWVQTVAHS
ncbi:MAG: hypothetical protein HFH57_11780 [Lachnospiraceae bacterium]|nr:hypothetical protein [Lachnospiraceae bacterium]